MTCDWQRGCVQISEIILVGKERSFSDVQLLAVLIFHRSIRSKPREGPINRGTHFSINQQLIHGVLSSRRYFRHPSVPRGATTSMHSECSCRSMRSPSAATCVLGTAATAGGWRIGRRKKGEIDNALACLKSADIISRADRAEWKSVGGEKWRACVVAVTDV